MNEFQGFWGAVARKAKAVLDDEEQVELETPRRARRFEDRTFTDHQDGRQFETAESRKKPDKAALRKGIGAIASSLNYIGNALEEGLTKVENRTVDIIQDTRNRRLNVRKKAAPDLNQQPTNNEYAKETSKTRNQTSSMAQSDTDIQLQASRDVAMAMAAKTKVLLRELKTVKADLAFAMERCAQLEEENKILRESMENGDNPDDDDLVRLQLETLLAEKARLAQENAVFARENRFLREVVEYHQLTMQDVVYLNERSEEITEVYPAKVPVGTNLEAIATLSPLSPSFHASELVFKENMSSNE